MVDHDSAPCSWMEFTGLGFYGKDVFFFFRYCEYSDFLVLYTGFYLELSLSKSGGVHESLHIYPLCGKFGKWNFQSSEAKWCQQDPNTKLPGRQSYALTHSATVPLGFCRKVDLNGPIGRHPHVNRSWHVRKITSKSQTSNITILFLNIYTREYIAYCSDWKLKCCGAKTEHLSHIYTSLIYQVMCDIMPFTSFCNSYDIAVVKSTILTETGKSQNK